MRKALPALVALVALVAPLAHSQDLSALPWRHIGPSSFGGRIDDVEAVPGRPATIFVGTAGGGVFRSINNGTTWDAVFDRDGRSTSIGDIAIAPSDPNIIWVGTGEPNNRQSSTWGDGVYRSLDGGTTWTHMGLQDTHHIGRVVVHPRDPGIVFVAALGHLWGPNAERGLYRSRDAGKTWQKVLAGNDVTGAVDVAMDPDGRTLYAAMYQRQRKAFGFVGGGPGSGLFRSLDGGDTWERLTSGLPTGTIGRIGIAIAPSQPATVYAIIESRQGGLFRSDDRGTTWRKTASLNPRPMYYSQVRVDARHPDKVWIVASSLHLSTDGGKTFTTSGTGDRIHVDHHGLWINPADGDHMIIGNDGGLYITYDGAKNWDFLDNLPIGQFYDIDVDDRDPYYVYGGTQDNGTWGVPVRTYNGVGITNADVINIAYGDGFYTVTDPADPRYIYANSQNGRAYRVHLGTREERGIRPVPDEVKESYRFNWSTPMHRSPHDAKTVYYGAQKLFRTRDAGQSWDEISPDLSRNLDWKKLPIPGFVRDSTTLSRDDGIADFGSITSIAESPRTAGAILVGTDDGNVQLTTDAGRTWTNITARLRLPAPRWVSRVVWSGHDARVAYVVFDGHQDDDMAPYVFRSTDAGATWTSVSGDLPARNSVKTIEEHPTNADVLFAGTEFGLYTTFNGGRTWHHVGGSVPRVRIDDIAVHPRHRDLILGTHGRSIIVLDDVSLFDRGAPNVASGDAVLYPIRPALQRYVTRVLPTPGARAFQAPNPPEGAIITYVLGDGSASDTLARFTVTGADGKAVRSFTAPATRGIHRTGWDLRYDRAAGVTNDDEGWFGRPRGGWVLPGRYTVTLEARGKKVSQVVEVRADTRLDVAASALTDRHTAVTRLAALETSFNEGVQLWQKMSTERKRIEDGVKDHPAQRDSLATTMKAVTQRLDSLGARFRPGFGGPKFSFLDLDGALQASSTGPTVAQQRTIDQLTVKLREDLTSLNALLTGDFAELERRAAGMEGALRRVVVP
ncbi:MAG: WD40/YVTN/BNR-like repeat-containing protein [Gemmatimonadaceae bacterium]